MKLLRPVTFILLNLVVGCDRQNKDQVRTEVEIPLRRLISPHVDANHVIFCHGKRFEHVRGEGEAYIELPSIHSILFVTDESDYSVTYHICRLDGSADIAIRAPSSAFGREIGMANSRDHVESVTPERIVLLNTGHQSSKKTWQTKIVLDLVRREVVTNETTVEPKRK